MIVPTTWAIGETPTWQGIMRMVRHSGRLDATTCSILLAWTLAGGSNASQSQGWVNKTVVAKEPGKIFIRAGNNIVGETTLLAFRVANQNGQWLELAGFPQGWVQASDFVPLESAVDHCTRMLAAQPQKAAHWLNLRGVAHFNLEQVDRAILDFDEAIRKEARGSIFFSNRGLAYLRQEKYDRAIVDFDQAIRLEPKNAPAYVGRGNALRDKGELARAIADYDAAIVLEPKSAPAHYNRAMTQEKIGNFDKALADLGQAARLDSKDPDAWNGIAWLLATCPDDKLRDGKKAIECAKFACELTKHADANNLDTLAAAHAEAGDFKEALAVAKKAHGLAGPDDKLAIAQRIALYEKSKPFRSVKPAN